MAEEETTTNANAVPVSTGDDHELRVLLAKHRIAPEKVAELRDAHRAPLYVLIDKPIIFRAMSNAQFERVGQKSEKERMKASRELVRSLVVHPSPEDFEKILYTEAHPDYAPLVWSTVLDAAIDIARGKPTAEAKKL